MKKFSAALLVLVIVSVPAVTQADHGMPAQASVRVVGGTLTYSALASATFKDGTMSIRYESMPIDANAGSGSPEALYYSVESVHDVGPGCEVTTAGLARCRADGIASVLVKGNPQRPNVIDVDMSDTTTGAVSPASVTVTGSYVAADQIRARDGVRQTLACNAIAGDRYSEIDANEVPTGCAFPGAFGSSTFGNGLFMGARGVVEVGLFCRHGYGSAPCAGTLTLSTTKGAGKLAGLRYRIRNGARGFNAKLKLSRSAQRRVRSSRGPLPVSVLTVAGSGSKRAESRVACTLLSTKGTKPPRGDPCASFR